MRAAGEDREGVRLRSLIVMLWRAELRISEALALAESDLHPDRGSICCAPRRGRRSSARQPIAPTTLHTTARKIIPGDPRQPGGRRGTAPHLYSWDVQPPDRVTVPTCIGCGAMSQPGTCERGCTEQKLELAPAGYYDSSTALAASARIGAEAFRDVVKELASRQPGAGEWRAAYRSAQEAARRSLRRYPEINPQDSDRDQPPELATTWWCAGCGGIDAPQPCLGICLWRPLEWVNATLSEPQRAHALAERDAERCLRLVLRRVASVTPRAGQWERGWRALEARARQSLQACDDDAQPHAGEP
jgi:hypothetical protein